MHGGGGRLGKYGGRIFAAQGTGAAGNNRARPGNRSEIAVDEGGQLGLGKRTDLRCLDVAALEEHQRRNAANAVFGGRFLVFIDVELGDLELATVLLGNVIENGSDHFAGTTPLSPVID